MRDDDTILVGMTKEKIEALPDSQKLNVILEILLPFVPLMYGDNGRLGIKRQVEKLNTQMKIFLGIAIAVLLMMIRDVFKR